MREGKTSNCSCLPQCHCRAAAVYVLPARLTREGQLEDKYLLECLHHQTFIRLYHIDELLSDCNTRISVASPFNFNRPQVDTLSQYATVAAHEYLTFYSGR
jgi:hypothetical protein